MRPIRDSYSYIGGAASQTESDERGKGSLDVEAVLPRMPATKPARRATPCTTNTTTCPHKSRLCVLLCFDVPCRSTHQNTRTTCVPTYSVCKYQKGADKKKQENGDLLPWVQPRIYYVRARACIAYVLTEAKNTYTRLDDLVVVVCIHHTRLHAYFGNYLAVYRPLPSETGPNSDIAVARVLFECLFT